MDEWMVKHFKNNYLYNNYSFNDYNFSFANTKERRTI